MNIFKSLFILLLLPSGCFLFSTGMPTDVVALPVTPVQSLVSAEDLRGIPDSIVQRQDWREINIGQPHLLWMAPTRRDWHPVRNDLTGILTQKRATVIFGFEINDGCYFHSINIYQDNLNERWSETKIGGSTGPLIWRRGRKVRPRGKRYNCGESPNGAIIIGEM